MTAFQIHMNQQAVAVAPIKNGRKIPVPIRVIELPPSDADVPHASAEELRLRAELLQAERQIAETVRNICSSLDPLWKKIDSRSEELKTTAVKLALLATRAIIPSELRDGSQRIRHLVESALARFPGGQKIQIRVNPDLLPRLRELFSGDSNREHLTLLADRDIKPGEVQLDHALFSLASDLEHHLNEMERAMLEALSDVDH